MSNAVSRPLLACSGLILLAGGFMHAAAYGKTVTATEASDLPRFFANAFKALWLIDSATLVTVAVVFGCLAVRPALASRAIIILVAMVPAATSLLLYRFLGNFLPAHMLLAAAVAAIAAALGMRASS